MKLLLHLALASAAVGAALALATLGAWTLRPGWVDAIDAQVRERYVRTAEERAAALTRLVATDARAAVFELDELAAEFAVARKGDRRFGARRAALRGLSDALAAAGEEDESLQTARELAGLDPRDLDVRSWLAARLLDAEATREEGLATWRTLFDEFPEVGSVAHPYYMALLELGSDEEAANVVARHAARAPRAETMFEGAMHPWQMFWGVTPEFSEERSAELTPGVWGRFLTMTFEVPAGANFLRLDPPMRSHLILDQPRIVLSTDAGPRALPIPFDRVSASDVVIDATELVTTGARDPWLYFELPEDRRGDRLEGRMVFGMERPPRWIGDATLRPAFQQAFAALQASGDTRTLGLLRGARAEALSRREWAVNAGQLERARAPLGTASGGVVVVDAVLAVDVEARVLEVLSPAVPGLVVQLSDVECESAGERIEVDLAAIVGSDMEPGGAGTWTVVGPRPFLRIELGAAAVQLQNIRLVGEVR